ncbi:MAG TPA: efflux RND transporter periplasmic adaptor subunit [Dissulfurispiraceae bacterium]|nr:efflux RND transporter periplasmic adaptor subunit [Dissulfurispiraceae bacterium]
MKRKVAMIAIPVVLLACIVYYFVDTQNSEPKYRTDKVTKGSITSSVTATGTVNAVTTVLVGTQVSGTIKNLYVDYNSPVKKGQLIARIDPSTFDAQVDQARANWLSAKANLDKSNASLIDAKRTFERNKQLFAKGYIAKSDLDTSETNLETSQAQVGVSKSAVAQTQAALRTAEINLQYTRIISPVDGIVISRNVDVGQTVAASFQTPTLFNIAQDLTKMQIDSSVVEADIGKVRVGMPVEFSVDAYPDTTFKGKVSVVRLAPVTVQNVVTYDVVVLVDNADLKLKPGMTANVSIIISSKDSVLRIPNAALRFNPYDKRKTPSDKGERGTGVWTLENGNPKRVKLTNGISDGNFTEVLSGNLEEGSVLIIEALTKGKTQQAPSGPPRMF